MSATRLYSWGVALVAGVVVTELCPVILGAGNKATVDFGFFYVTMHFVVLPIASLVLIGAAGVGVVTCARNHQARRAAKVGAVGLFPVCYLLALALYPGPWVR